MLPPPTSTVIAPKINPKQFRKGRSRIQRRLRSENNTKAVEELTSLIAKQESIVFHTVRVVEGLAIDPTTSVEDKIIKVAELHAQWKREDREIAADVLDETELIQRQKQRCKDMGMIIFGFTLNDKQADAVWTLLYE